MVESFRPLLFVTSPHLVNENTCSTGLVDTSDPGVFCRQRIGGIRQVVVNMFVILRLGLLRVGPHRSHGTALRLSA